MCKVSLTTKAKYLSNFDTFRLYNYILFNKEEIFLHIPEVPPQLFSLSAVLVGVLLVDDSTPNEQNALGNWLMLVSQYLCTNAAYGQLLQSNTQTPGSFNENNTQNQANKSSNSNSSNAYNTSNASDEETLQMLIKMVNALNKEIEEIKKYL